MNQLRLGTQVFLVSMFGAVVGVLWVLTFSTSPLHLALSMVAGAVAGNLAIRPREAGRHIWATTREIVLPVLGVMTKVLGVMVGMFAIFAAFSGGYYFIGALMHRVMPNLAGTEPWAILFFALNVASSWAYTAVRSRSTPTSWPLMRRLIRRVPQLAVWYEKPKSAASQENAAPVEAAREPQSLTPAQRRARDKQVAKTLCIATVLAFCVAFIGSISLVVVLLDALVVILLKLGSSDRVAVTFGAAAGTFAGFVLRTRFGVPPAMILAAGGLIGGIVGRAIHAFHEFIVAHPVEFTDGLAAKA